MRRGGEIRLGLGGVSGGGLEVEGKERLLDVLPALFHRRLASVFLHILAKGFARVLQERERLIDDLLRGEGDVVHVEYDHSSLDLLDDGWPASGGDVDLRQHAHLGGLGVLGGAALANIVADDEVEKFLGGGGLAMGADVCIDDVLADSEGDVVDDGAAYVVVHLEFRDSLRVAGAALRKVERCARRENARVGGDDAGVGLVGICLVVLVEAHSDEEIPIRAVGARRAAEVGQYVLDEAVRRHHVDVRHGEGYTDTRMLTAPVLIMEKSLRSFDDVTSS